MLTGFDFNTEGFDLNIERECQMEDVTKAIKWVNEKYPRVSVSFTLATFGEF